MRCHYTPIKMENFKGRTIPSAGEDVEDQELSGATGGNAKRYNHLAKQFDSFSKRYIPTILSNHSAPIY